MSEQNDGGDDPANDDAAADKQGRRIDVPWLLAWSSNRPGFERARWLGGNRNDRPGLDWHLAAIVVHNLRGAARVCDDGIAWNELRLPVNGAKAASVVDQHHPGDTLEGGRPSG